MSKRIVIWIAVVLVGVATIALLQHLRQHQMGTAGKVTFQEKSGDLIAFLTHELQRYGANLTLPGHVPSLNTDWRYAEDAKGFQILLPKARKDELIQVLSQTLGKPELREEYPQMIYREDRFGVGIVADLESDPLHIICLRKGAL